MNAVLISFVSWASYASLSHEEVKSLVCLGSHTVWKTVSYECTCLGQSLNNFLPGPHVKISHGKKNRQLKRTYKVFSCSVKDAKILQFFLKWSGWFVFTYLGKAMRHERSCSLCMFRQNYHNSLHTLGKMEVR